MKTFAGFVLVVGVGFCAATLAVIATGHTPPTWLAMTTLCLLCCIAGMFLGLFAND